MAAYAAFASPENTQRRTVNRWESARDHTPHADKAAKNLFEVAAPPVHSMDSNVGNPVQSTNLEQHNPVPSTGLHSTTSPLKARPCRNKAWYYHRDADGRACYLAFVNAKGSCSMRTFDAETGRFLDKKYPQGGGAYQDKFASLIQNAKEVIVYSQPNLERDCKERLPKSVLDDLKKQIGMN